MASNYVLGRKLANGHMPKGHPPTAEDKVTFEVCVGGEGRTMKSRERKKIAVWIAGNLNGG